MVVKITSDLIKRLYGFPDENLRTRKVYYLSPGIVIANLCVLAFVHIVDVRIPISQLGWNVIFSLSAYFSLIALVIVVVERGERRRKSPAVTVIDKISNVAFAPEGVSIEVSFGEECTIHMLPITDIKSISGYVQDGWLRVRDRGVVIETNDNKQIRIVLGLNKTKFKLFIDELMLSLGEINYPIKGVRFFQV